MELFGRRAGPGVLLFMQQGSREFDRLKERVTGTNDAFRMQVLQNQTLQGSWRMFTSAVKDARVEFGQGLSPVLASVLGQLGKMIGRLRESDVFKRLGAALGTVLKPVAEIGGDLGSKFVDWLIRSQDLLAEKAAGVAQGIADWFTKANAGGKTGFQSFAADLLMVGKALWDLTKAIAGASWQVIIAAMEKMAEKAPEIADEILRMVPIMSDLADQVTKFLGNEEKWNRLEGNINRIGGALEWLAQNPIWPLLVWLFGPGIAHGIGSAGAKGLGGVIGRLLGFGGKVAPPAAETVGRTLGPAAPVAQEVMGPLGGIARQAPRGLGLLGRAGRLLGRVALPLGIAAHAYEGAQALRTGGVRGFGNWIGPQLPGMSPLSFGIAKRIGNWEYGLGRGLYDRLTGGPEGSAMAGAAEGGYGTQAVIVINTNDETQIGQIAQREYDRARGAQRRQLVR
jgi:hypothetical protein